MDKIMKPQCRICEEPKLPLKIVNTNEGQIPMCLPCYSKKVNEQAISSRIEE